MRQKHEVQAFLIPIFKKKFQKQKDGQITVSEGIKELGISRRTWYNRAAEQGLI